MLWKLASSPPSAKTTANYIDRRATVSGLADIRCAAADGVMARLSTSRIRPQGLCREAMARLVAEHPWRYAGLSLRDLCDQMHAALRAHKAHKVVRLLDEAFGTLPSPVLPPGAPTSCSCAIRWSGWGWTTWATG